MKALCAAGVLAFLAGCAQPEAAAPPGSAQRGARRRTSIVTVEQLDTTPRA